MNPRKILVPIDFSEHSRSALLAACDLAVRFRGQLTLLHVCHAPAFSATEVAPGSTSSVLADVVTETSDDLRRGRAVAEQNGCTNTLIASTWGFPPSEIVRYARDGGFDLIVMGTHGRTGLRRALLGSVAEEVVRRASCPVLTVPLAQQGAPASVARP